MRGAAFILLTIVGAAFLAPAAEAIYPFGGKIAAVYFDEECNDLVLVVVGVRGGIFEYEASTIWYTLPAPPPAGVWTIGVADLPPPCSNILFGGASQLP